MSDKKLIVWGGVDSAGVPLNSGATYDAVSNSWTPISNAHTLAARQLHSGMRTGTKMLIWGGCTAIAGTAFSDGAIYDPASDSWTAMTATAAPSARCAHSTVAAGNKMIVWGGSGGSPQNTGGIYDPENNTWTATSTSSAPDARLAHGAVWTGTNMIVWGGIS